MAGPSPSPNAKLRPIDMLIGPFTRFARIESASGILLIGCTIAAMVWANLWPEHYEALWHTYVKVAFGSHELKLSLGHFINDGLMAIFFFVVGLEVKREFLAGELNDRRKAAIPIAAALGGMLVPAALFVLFNLGNIGSAAGEINGWAIPMATDIAFAVGIMAILGDRVPLSVRVFVTSLAIVDDIGAVLVIALFYTDTVLTVPLLIAAGLVLLSFVMNRLAVRTALVYALIGLATWLMVLASGVHATIAGVALALTIPVDVRIEPREFLRFGRQTLDAFEAAGTDKDDIIVNTRRQSAVYGLEAACEQVQSPLRRLEHQTHFWTAFAIVPLFALSNAGIPLAPELATALVQPFGLGIAVGLLVGKPVGILLFTWLAVTLGLGTLPGSWRQMIGAAFLAGIGFTMSLFIANLAFADTPLLLYAKGAILAGSVAAGVIGFILLRTAPEPAD